MQSRRLASSYRTNQLLNQTLSAPYPFSFFVGVESGEPALDGMLRSSGGNTMHAAISLCRHVDLYGSGLHSEGASAIPSIVQGVLPPAGVGPQPG